MPLQRESRDFRTATFTQFLEQAGHITGIGNLGRERTLELDPTLAFFGNGHRKDEPMRKMNKLAQAAFAVFLGSAIAVGGEPQENEGYKKGDFERRHQHRV